MAKRKLTTIFCADAVQYGALMAADEDGTLARLSEYRAVMNDQFARYDGREINTWGDAVIAEFDSVVEAVRCAVEIQTALGSRNDMLPDANKLQFRIGINLGDVIHQGDNIYGDGVNIASRLESMADPGGIMVSKSVHDFTARQLAVGFDFGGSHVAKEGETPVEGYKVRIGTSNRPSAIDRESDGESRSEAPTAGASTESPRGDSSQHRAYGATPPPIADDAKTFADTLQSLPTVSWWRNWYAAQSKKVRWSALAIVGMFTINLLFSGLANPWFIIPSLPFLLIIWLGQTKPEA
ncbi:MAG: adenylate/guanylate cyclase domain-containing protein [Rhizobiaceae bacterium]